MARLLVIAAAGSGIRLGRVEPKALVLLCGRPLLSWTLEAFAALSFARAVVAAPPDRVDEFARLTGDRAKVVPGGASRSDSVRQGFEALAAVDGDIVAVHDAARPLVTGEEVDAVLRSAEQTGAAIAATPIVDTIKKVSLGRIVETVDRTGLYRAATPQAFRADILRRALETERDATDEAALCESLGIPVTVVPVSRLSFKITTPGDLELVEAVLAARRKV